MPHQTWPMFAVTGFCALWRLEFDPRRDGGSYCLVSVQHDRATAVWFSTRDLSAAHNSKSKVIWLKLELH